MGRGKAGKDAMLMWAESLDYFGFGEEMIKARLDLPVCLLYFISTLYDNTLLKTISLETQRPLHQLGEGTRRTLFYRNTSRYHLAITVL
jgi:hypothetical protein